MQWACVTELQGPSHVTRYRHEKYTVNLKYLVQAVLHLINGVEMVFYVGQAG